MRIFLTVISIALFAQINYAQNVGANTPGSVSSDIQGSEHTYKGGVSHSVNHFTGLANVSTSLGSISHPNGLSFELSMSYSSSGTISTNGEAIGGIPYGDGWNLNIPMITVQNSTYRKYSKYDYEYGLIDNLPNTPIYEHSDRGVGLQKFHSITVSIPGIISEKFVYKTKEQNDYVFIPEKFTTYVEARLNSGRWTVLLNNGDEYEFGTGTIRVVNASSQRMDKSFYDDDFDSPTQAVLTLPKTNITAWYCSKISTERAPGDIKFLYEPFPGVSRFKGTVGAQGDAIEEYFFPSNGNSARSFAESKQVYLKSVYTEFRKLELDYKALELEEFPVNPTDEIVNELYLKRKIYEQEFTSNEHNWNRILHSKSTNINPCVSGSVEPKTSPATNPYVFQGAVAEDIASDKPHVNGGLPFTTANNVGDESSGYLESESLPLEIFKSGDEYEIEIELSGQSESNFDFSVHSNRESGFNFENTQTPEYYSNNCYAYKKGPSIFNTFTNALKPRTNSSNKMYASFTFPSLPPLYNGISMSIGPANNDLDNNDGTHSLNWYGKYFDNTGTEALKVSEQIPSNFGTGHPWQVLKEYFKAQHNIGDWEQYKWWVCGDPGGPVKNQPTLIETQNKLKRVVVYRYMKRPMVLNKVEYKIKNRNGDYQTVTTKKLQHEAKSQDNLGYYEYNLDTIVNRWFQSTSYNQAIHLTSIIDLFTGEAGDPLVHSFDYEEIEVMSDSYLEGDPLTNSSLPEFVSYKLHVLKNYDNPYGGSVEFEYKPMKENGFNYYNESWNLWPENSSYAYALNPRVGMIGNEPFPAPLATPLPPGVQICPRLGSYNNVQTMPMLYQVNFLVDKVIRIGGDVEKVFNYTYDVPVSLDRWNGIPDNMNWESALRSEFGFSKTIAVGPGPSKTTEYEFHTDDVLFGKIDKISQFKTGEASAQIVTENNWESSSAFGNLPMSNETPSYSYDDGFHSPGYYDTGSTSTFMYNSKTTTKVKEISGDYLTEQNSSYYINDINDLGNSSKFNLKASWTTNSDGNVHKNMYYYIDSPGQSQQLDDLQKLKDRHVYGLPVEIKTLVSGTQIGGKRLHYKVQLVDLPPTGTAGFGPTYGKIVAPIHEDIWDYDENGGGQGWDKNITYLKYSPHGQLVESKARNEKVTNVVSYTRDGLVEKEKFGSREKTYVYDEETKRLKKVIGIDGQEVEKIYHPNGILDEERMRNGNMKYEYSFTFGGGASIDINKVFANTQRDYNLNDSYGMDGFGRTVGITTGGINSVSEKYNAYDKIVEKCDSKRGACFTYEYEDEPTKRMTVEKQGNWPRNKNYLYDINGGGDVSGYSSGDLLKVITIDENNNTSEQYYDKLGRMIQTTRISEEGKIKTVYTYDLKGNVSEILPPGGGLNYVYQYKYDERNRLIEKKVPNQENWTINTYDEYDQLETTELPNGKKLFYSDYNDYKQVGTISINSANGPVLSGFGYKESGPGIGSIESEYHAVLDGNYNDGAATTYVYDEYGRLASKNEVGLTMSDTYVYTYDDADVLYHTTRSNDHIATTSNFTSDEFGREKDHFMTINGRTEHVSISSFNAAGWLTGVSLGNSGNGSLGGFAKQYNGRGWVTKINDIIECNIPQVLQEVDLDDLDNPVLINGVVNVTVDLEQNPVIVNVTNTHNVSQGGNVIYTTTNGNNYNPNNAVMSQNPDQKVFNYSGRIPRQTMYDVLYVWLQELGRLKGIPIKDIPTIINNLIDEIPDLYDCLFPPDYLFGSIISYEDGVFPQYNGNISKLKWKTFQNPINTYRFSYDQLNRLTKADHFINYNGAPPPTQYLPNYDVEIQYTSDGRGNISSIKRNGVRNMIEGYTVPGIVDEMSIGGYNGDLATSVSDLYPEYGSSFEGGTLSYYEGSGALKSHSGKGINNIDYNYLDLPQLIETINGNMTISYDASGQKHEQISYEGNYGYLGGVVTKDGVLEGMYFDHGRVVPDAESESGYRFEYTIEDHLGNNRVFFSDKNHDGELQKLEEILKESHYYPFGMSMEGDWIGSMRPPDGFGPAFVNRFNYNGKEFTADLGIEMYDYGARWYDPSIGRFNTVDPLAEKYSFQTNYAYAANNPIRFADINGLEPGDPPKRKYLAISMMKETNYRANNFNFYAKGVKSLTIKSGINSLVDALTKESTDAEISFMSLFSHGTPNSIWGDGESIGIDNLKTLKGAVDNGSISFSKDAVIFMGACNCGTSSGGTSFAQELADITGASVYAMVDDSVEPVKESTGQTNNPEMSYGAKYDPKNSKFNIFKPGSQSVPVNENKVDVIQLYRETRQKQNQNDKN